MTLARIGGFHSRVVSSALEVAARGIERRMPHKIPRLGAKGCSTALKSKFFDLVADKGMTISCVTHLQPLSRDFNHGRGMDID